MRSWRTAAAPAHGPRHSGQRRDRPRPDHVGSRLSLAGGILPNDPAAFRRWIAHTEEVKPGVHMPSFGMLPEGELRALVAYLEQLK